MSGEAGGVRATGSIRRPSPYKPSDGKKGEVILESGPFIPLDYFHFSPAPIEINAANIPVFFTLDLGGLKTSNRFRLEA